MKERIKTSIQKANHKKYIVFGLFMIAVLMSSQLLVGCSKYIDTNQTEALENDTEEMEYINESLGYSITLPKNLMERVVIEKNNNTVYIVSKMISESESGFPGIIIYINPIRKSEYPSREELNAYIEDESPVPLYVIGETENDYICYSTATDVQYPPDDEVMTKEYKELTDEFNNLDFKFSAVN